MRVELRLQPLAFQSERVRSRHRSPLPSDRPSVAGSTCAPGTHRALLRSLAMQTAERTWWARPGLEVRDGRLAIAGRDAEATRARARHARVRARPRGRARAGDRAARRDGRRGSALPDPLRAQGAARPRLPAVPARARRRSSGWTCARPARPSGRSRTGGRPRRSATPARTCRRRDLDRDRCRPGSTSTSICSPSSSGSDGARPARRSGSA